jgi:FAD/FMN-containing dehydrogenase/Fe-S oxidoreductase
MAILPSPLIRQAGRFLPRSQAPSGPAPGAVPFAAAEALAEDLYHRISGEVRFDAGARALYATDASNYRQVPIGVVIPRSDSDVMETLAACRRHGAPVLARGGGTSLAGQCCNVAVVMDMSKYYNRIVKIDPEKRNAVVQPGLVLDNLRGEAEKSGLTFGPDPATHNHCTLGGMIGNNSCGVHSVMAGKTMDNVIELDIATYAGERMTVGACTEDELENVIRKGGAQGRIYAQLKDLRDRYADEIRARMPKLARRSSGYNLDMLLPENGFHVARALTGTEGSCVTILNATLRLVESPSSRVMVLLGYPDVYSAADHVLDILPFGPIGLEGLDEKLVGYEKRKGLHVKDLPLLPEGRGWLLVEFGAPSRAEAEAKAHALFKALKKKPGAPSTHLYDDRDHEEKIWQIREAGLGATARIPGEKDTWEGWEDSSVPPAKLGSYLRELSKLFDKFGYDGALYGHFGQGCVHTRINFDLQSRPGIEKFRSFLDAAADLVLRHGGSLSGEHGDGQSRAELLPKMYGHKLVRAFEEFKAIWDPGNKMNPGKKVHPYPITSNLRLGTTYRPKLPDTHFRFPEDDGSLARATLRCVGVGECRRMEKGTMCPSYRVTGEEKHSTRGRAHLLWEMLRGDSLPGGFRSEAVKESLDLCLSCKGCKNDCPVNVDMATYKAEFLAGYYKGRLRPLSAYALGLIRKVCEAAALAPGLANAVMRAPVLGDIAKAVAGISPHREMPGFAPQTFKRWMKGRMQVTPRASSRGGSDGRSRVILWPDTFNDHFHPEVAASALEVLEDAGYRVDVPRAALCCGRPLYDFGMLHQAREHLVRIVDALRPDIRAGIPVVGLEPSCISVFRDELPNLLAGDEDATRLSKQSFLLDEFLMREGSGYEPPRLRGKAIVHGHCHQKSVLDARGHGALLKAMGIDFTEPESGCCGMAGSFGFEKEKYEISMKIGERHLLPAVRQAGRDVFLIANGFSCREQIRAVPGRKALHMSQVLHIASRGWGAQSALVSRFHPRRLELPWALIGAGALAAGAAGAAIVALARKRRRHG